MNFYILNPNRSDQPMGPFTVLQIKSMLESGILTRSHYFAKDGDLKWTMISESIVFDNFSGNIVAKPEIPTNTKKKSIWTRDVKDIKTPSQIFSDFIDDIFSGEIKKYDIKKILFIIGAVALLILFALAKSPKHIK